MRLAVRATCAVAVPAVVVLAVVRGAGAEAVATSGILQGVWRPTSVEGHELRGEVARVRARIEFSAERWRAIDSCNGDAGEYRLGLDGTFESSGNSLLMGCRPYTPADYARQVPAVATVEPLDAEHVRLLAADGTTVLELVRVDDCRELCPAL